MPQKKVIVIGTGHLADVTEDKLAEGAKFEVIRIKSKTFQFDEDTDIQEESLQYAKERLVEAGIQKAFVVCLVDSTDGLNVHVLLAVAELRPDIPTFVSIIDETIYHNVSGFDHNVVVVNPAKIAEPAFISALEERLPKQRSFMDQVVQRTLELPPPKKSRAAVFMTALILVMMGIDILFFMMTEGLSFTKAYYYFASEVTSFSFGDVMVKQYDPWIENTRTTLLLMTFAIVPIGIGIIAGTWWAHLNELRTTGKRRYRMRDHIVVCGLGNLGYRIAETLFEKGLRVLVIERELETPNVELARARGIPVMIADATARYALTNANVGRAAAIISAVNDDMQSLKIGLGARWFNPNLRIVLRIFDRGTANAICERFGIQFALSMSDMASDKIVGDILQLAGTPRAN
ncbi:MAG: NAD-binding protein [bacterium]|nr:NAD-binding protein [bacterium]